MPISYPMSYVRAVELSRFKVLNTENDDLLPVDDYWVQAYLIHGPLCWASLLAIIYRTYIHSFFYRTFIVLTSAMMHNFYQIIVVVYTCDR